MNKYWAAVVCTILLCATTLISVYYVVDKNKYEYMNFSDNNGIIRINTHNGETSRFYASKGWVKIEQQ